MLSVWKHNVLLIPENRLGLVKSNFMLLQVRGCFWRIPFEIQSFQAAFATGISIIVHFRTTNKHRFRLTLTAYQTAQPAGPGC